MKEILSAKNTWIKELKKYHQKKYREEAQKYLLEGFHLLEEAEKSGAELTAVLYTGRGEKEWGSWLSRLPEDRLCHVSDEVMASLSDLPAPQGILGVAAMETHRQPDFAGAWLLLDSVQDPGNVGTMIRTADAAGMTGVILGKGTADIYSTKVLRSMQGSNFHLPVFSMDIKEAISHFKECGSKVFGTELNPQAVPYDKCVKTENFALIMGNEGQGVNKDFLKLSDNNIYIPVFGKAESLNVAVAGGILMYRLLGR